MENNEIDRSIRITKTITDITRTECNVNDNVNKLEFAFRRYSNETRLIIDYTRQYLRENECQNGIWKINIPKENIPFFGFFKSLDIEINVLDIDSSYSDFLLGYEGFHKEYAKAMVANGAFIEPQTMRIYGYSKGTYLYSNILSNTLAHVIRHKNKELKWNAKGCHSNDRICRYIGDITNFANYQDFSDDNEKEYFITIFRYLFSSEGMDNLIKDVFQDLRQLTDNKNFENNLLCTKGGQIYQYIRERLPLLEFIDEEKFYVLSCFMGKNDKLYKRHFIATVQMKLKELYQKLGDIAIYDFELSTDESYYRVSEHFRNINVINDYGTAKIFN